jgi:hypothetical protein
MAGAKVDHIWIGMRLGGLEVGAHKRILPQVAQLRQLESNFHFIVIHVTPDGCGILFTQINRNRLPFHRMMISIHSQSY